MKRMVFLATLIVLVAGLAAWADDEIRFYDRVKRVEINGTGTITAENAGSVVYKHTTGSREVPAEDVIDITYQVRPALALKFRASRTKETNAEKAPREERKKAYADLIQEYRQLIPDLTDNPKAQRHIEYKIGRALARLAEDDPSQRQAAIDALQAFRKKHPDSWQLINATKILVGLLTAADNHAAAARALDELAATKNIPRETRQWAELEAAQALVRAKQLTEAKTRMDAVLKTLKPDDPQVVRVQLYLTSIMTANGQTDEAVKILEGLLNKVSDPSLKAAAYNALGDCYQASKKPKEALWQYLWVDVIYNQDKTEHVKALQNIARLFDDLKDEARAKQYRDKLAKYQ